MKIGDRVIVNNTHKIFAGCEGFIIEDPDTDFNDMGFLVDLYKGNDTVTEDELNEYYVYFNIDELDLL